jgi:hypothetical protein
MAHDDQVTVGRRLNVSGKSVEYGGAAFVDARAAAVKKKRAIWSTKMTLPSGVLIDEQSSQREAGGGDAA